MPMAVMDRHFYPCFSEGHMKIEIRLKKILKDYNLDEKGIAARIASETDLHRHTVTRLYRNEQKNPSLEALGEICDWLERHHVPANILPEALLGAESSSLFDAVTAMRSTTVYLGEY